MKDTFVEMIGRYIVPLSELGNRTIDSTYFLRKDGSLVFAQGYYHPPGKISGKIIYYPKKGGWVDIFGRDYDCMHKTYKAGRMYSYTNPQQIEKHYKVFPELARGAQVAPLIKNNLLFPLGDFTGFFEPRKSLRLGMELYPKIDRGARAAGEILGVPLEKMGLTGSLQYGRLEVHDDDTDFIFYGTVEENYELMQKILDIVREDPKRRVYEFSKFWPLRFYHGGILVCPFFIYADMDEIPLRDCRIRSTKMGVEIRGRITDIRHSIYMPLVFPLEDVEVEGEKREKFVLILSDSYVRGEFEAGQCIYARGELVEIEKASGKYEALIAANNWDVKTGDSRQ